MNTKKAHPRQVGIYARISKDEKGEELGVGRQLDICRDLVPDGATVREYVDNSRSAYSLRKRPAFEQMLADVEDGSIDTIICYAADRLWRRPADLERLVRIFEPSKVEIIAATSGDIDLNTADGRAMARVLGAFGAREVEKTSERIKAAKAQRRAQGKYDASRRPFGWVQDVDGWHPHSEESAYLKDAYRQVLAGSSLGSIQRQWQGTGSNGGEFTTVQLRAALLNGRHAGIIVRNGSKARDFADGRRIIDEDVYWQAVAILTDPSRVSPRGRPRRTLLGGIARCGRCGRLMQSTIKYERNPSTGKRDRPRRVYVCQRGGQHLTRSAELADGPILALLAVTLERYRDDLAAAARSAQEVGGAGESVEQLEQRLDALRSLAVDGAITAEDFADMAEKVRERIAEARRDAAPTSVSGALEQIADADDIEAALRQLLADDPPAARAVVTEVFETITLVPTGNGQAAGPEHIEYVIKGAA